MNKAKTKLTISRPQRTKENRRKAKTVLLKKRRYVLSAVLLCAPFFLPSILFAIPWTARNNDFSFDAPDCFILNDYTETSYHFTSTALPVTFIAATYDDARYASPIAALKDVTQKLRFTIDAESFTYRTSDAAFAKLTTDKTERTAQAGFAVSAELSQKRGVAVFVGFYSVSTNADTNALCESLIISSLDSISIDKAGLTDTGIVTSFIYPKEGDIEETLTIGNKSIIVPLDAIDKEANQYVIEREFLILYLESSCGYGKSACKRFYRMVYRDAYPRLRRLSFAVQNALTMGDDAITDRFLLAQTLLQWTQSFDYERNLAGSDFTSLPALACGKGGDCDSRALLLAVMLRQMNYDTAFFVSSTYSHAVLGIDVAGKGARIPLEGVSYLLGETTARVNLGLIAQDMSDSSQWMGVTFPK